MRALLLLGALSMMGCATTTSRLKLPPLQTVPKVDVQRYLGTWYELASFPQSFQKGCTASTANYSLEADGELEVLNRCRLESLEGKEKEAKGRARVVDKESNAKLEVSFFGPFWGDYWIVQLGDAYEYAVVGHPSRDYLWILSRTPTMDEAKFEGILEKLKTEQQYPLERLQRTLQPK